MGAMDGLITGLGSVKAVITNLLGGSSSSGGGGGGTTIVRYEVNLGAADPMYLTEGDIGPSLVYYLRDIDSRPYILSDADEITFHMKSTVSGSVAEEYASTADDTLVIVDAPMGKVRVDWSEEVPVPDAGSYTAWFVVNGVHLPLGRVIPVTILAGN